MDDSSYENEYNEGSVEQEELYHDEETYDLGSSEYEDVVPLGAIGLTPPEQHRTSPYLSRYEEARVIGVRALQLENNAPAMLDTRGEYDPIKIARMELAARVMPLVVRRRLPDGFIETRDVNELEWIY